MTLVRQVSVFFLSLSYFFCAKMPIKKCFQRFSGIRFELNSVEWIPDSTPVDCVIKLRMLKVQQKEIEDKTIKVGW